MMIDKDKTTQELVENLFFVFRALHKGLESQGIQSDLTIPQKIVMGQLSRFGDLSVKELSQKVRLSHSTVSGIVDRLERKGLAARIPDQQDRRITKVTVTDLGRNELKLLPQQMFSGIVNRYHQATNEEQREVLAGLAALRRLLDWKE